MGVVVGLRRVVGMAMFMAVGVTMLMAVVPQLGLVEQKEKHQTHQQGDEQLVGRSPRFKGLGQQMHEGRGQQSACRQTEQMLCVGRQQGPGAQGGHQHAAHACGQGAQDYIDEVQPTVLVGSAAGAASKQGTARPHGHSFKPRRFVSAKPTNAASRLARLGRGSWAGNRHGRRGACRDTPRTASFWPQRVQFAKPPSFGPPW